MKKELDKYEKDLLLRMKNKKLICNISRVSRSGMSRTMKFFFIGKNGNLYNVTNIIASITDQNINKNGELRVSGCGMDMVFHVLSSFNYAMARRETGKTTNNYDSYYINADKYQLI
jgi:hypothetical protein